MKKERDRKEKFKYRQEAMKIRAFAWTSERADDQPKTRVFECKYK